MIKLLFSAALCYLFTWLTGAEECQQRGFFGKGCKFKCNCENDMCNDEGDCIAPSSCIIGKFGPACQYARLEVNEKANLSWAIDQDDSTCNPDVQDQTLTITIESVFTWARMKLNSKIPLDSNFHQLSVNFDSGISCMNSVIYRFSKYVIDVHCENKNSHSKLHLNGFVIGYLCEIYISLGRNVALKQKTTTSNVYKDGFESDYGVDGNRSYAYADEKLGCPQVAFVPKQNKFKVLFHQPMAVHSTILCSITEKEAYQTQAMLMFFINETGTEVFRNFTADSPDSCVSVKAGYKFAPITEVQLSPSYTGVTFAEERRLFFCELEVYGDVICDNGTYGLDCEKNCSHCPENDCLQTGGCKLPCPPGTQYLGCHSECDRGYYGTMCSEICSECLNNDCDGKTGSCYSCRAGRGGADCSEECPKGYYGANCSEICDECLNGDCDSETGVCYNCKIGRRGASCNEECGSTFYGPKCSKTCSEFCADKHCDSVTGECYSCVPGRTGEQCRNVIICNSTFYGPQCLNPCSESCVDRKCDSATGKCDTCPPGRSGDQCNSHAISKCNPTLYGPKCSLYCPESCVDRMCNVLTGECFGCEPGHRGKQCEETDTGFGILSIFNIILGAGLVGMIVAAIFQLNRGNKNGGTAEQTKDQISAPTDTRA